MSDRRAAPKSAFVIFETRGKDGSVSFLLSEQDMRSGPNTGMWEPALDALGGKLNGGEDYLTAACREVEEESGGLICDEHLERLRAWIEAQQLADSPDVYHDQEGKALFFYYPIPHEMKKFWFLLNHSFTKNMSGKQLDRTRSASRLHWVKLTWRSVIPSGQSSGFHPDECAATLPIVAPVHVCVPGCASRCGRTECTFRDKALGVKPHVLRALQHRREQLRQACLQPAPAPPQQQ